MKVAAYIRYGPPEVIQITEVESAAPKANEVKIKVHATTVTSGDCRVRSLNVPNGFGLIIRLAFGITKPRQTVLGSELSGVVSAVGSSVQKFKVGDAVFAFSDAAMGCYAEYKCMVEDGAIAMKPATLSYGEAAALSFGGTTALSFLKRAKVLRGERVLINGASGAVGTALVQLANSLGAEVTGVCSAANAALVKSLGAKSVIDYKKEDFTKNAERYDVIVDAVGNAPYTRCKASLKDNSRLLLLAASLPEMLQIPWISLSSNKRVFAGPASGKSEDLRLLAELVEAGKFKPVIDRSFPFVQIVDAHRYVDTGRKQGNVVVNVS